MLLIQLSTKTVSLFFAKQLDIINILIIIFIFFGILLFIGLRKSFQLKKENERLEALNDKMNKENEDDDKKPYQDFTEGHIYGDSNSSSHIK
ncbi:hypothetical protein Q4566_04080 [Tamlana sp. 2_MG-2023]|uniref:hypothetical protein n=1 Tax=unclassified Tamlana TaxID=2614803 RepID=UPI0026E39A2D|nr:MULTISPECIES: hypothetical protein [unclassified Tamlana]MDO6759368.1 hypothetical protein [Tamlana sp. 2_MG-2023]MDO6790493.1 hypothetical protein [Tamlana sp. 1_MG-2023]